jgi:hypothetical protein
MINGKENWMKGIFLSTGGKFKGFDFEMYLLLYLDVPA